MPSLLDSSEQAVARMWRWDPRIALNFVTRCSHGLTKSPRNGLDFTMRAECPRSIVEVGMENNRVRVESWRGMTSVGGSGRMD
jgi:hypothetical protein